MAATTQITVTKDWTELADSDCTVQSVFSSELFQIAINATEPTTDACIKIRLNEPVNFSYKTAVWCRLNQSAMSIDSAKITVIK